MDVLTRIKLVGALPRWNPLIKFHVGHAVPRSLTKAWSMKCPITMRSLGFRIAVAVIPLFLFSPALAQPTTDFGRMFPKLPAFQPAEDLLTALAAKLQDPNRTAPAGIPNDDNPNGSPSGFTYLGQFLDHDITLDVTPLGEATIDVAGITNGRTPRLDLDSLYGGGQIGSPGSFDDRGRFKFADPAPFGFADFQRDSLGHALIAEGRNDENLIVAQIDLLFRKLHNRFIDSGHSFSEAQRLTRWHWQWIVVHEFLPETVGQETVNLFLKYNGAGKPTMRYDFFKPDNPNRPMMPVEFSAPAFRFGHSMIRLAYVVQGATLKTQVFHATRPDLRGSRPIPPELKIAFENFFHRPRAGGVAYPPPVNISRKIDSLISASLFALPVGPVVPNEVPRVVSLPERTLLRGKRMGLPSYQDVAQSMGIRPLTNAELDHDSRDPLNPGALLGLSDPRWGGKVPLWFGILKESEIVNGGRQLGPTGGRIVAEVILGLIDKDQSSYFNSPQPWSPPGGQFKMADLVTFVNGW